MLAAGRSHLDRGIWEVVLGREPAECLAYLKRLVLVEQALSPTHYTHFLVAEVNGHRAAALCGYHAPEARYLPEALGRVDHELRYTAAHSSAWTVLAECARREDLVDGAWMIEYVATLPEFQRQGLMTALLRAMLERARQKGCRVAQVYVLTGNTRAEEAYRRESFQVVCERKSSRFSVLIGCSGMKLLRRVL